MAWCDEEVGHVWGARSDGWVRKGQLCGCWAIQPDGNPGHTPCPRDYKATDPSGWVSEKELLSDPEHGTDVTTA
jgi:hypothetical protein